MEWVDRQLEKWSGKTGLPEWAIALISVFAVDLLLTGLIVGAVSVSHAAVSSKAKMWTDQELKDRFLLKSMDEIKQTLPYRANMVIDSVGNLSSITFHDVPAAPDGRLRRAYFFGQGGRCWDCGFEGK